MIGESVSRERIIDMERAEGVPGLYNVRLEDGEVLRDLPTVVAIELAERNGFTPEGSNREL